MLARAQSIKWGRLANLSTYAHADPRLCQQTLNGAIVTVLGVLLALTLLVSEVKQCMTTQRVQELVVDTARNKRLHINFNISFPALPCETLLMDVQDVSGRFQTDSTVTRAKNGEIHKFQLSPEGRRLHIKEYVAPNRAGNPFAITLDDADMESMKQALSRGEGCNIYGWLAVERVAGNLHFTVRPEAMFLSMTTEEIMAALSLRHSMLGGDLKHPDASRLNTSHVVHAFNFGPRFPGQELPLDSMRRIDRKANGVDKYFIKVVPTEYQSLYGWKLQTNQYSVTEYYHQLGEYEEQPPAVFFLYDMSPIKMIVRETRPGLLRLLVRLCAVVGGVFAVTGLVDRMTHAAVKAVLRQMGSQQLARAAAHGRRE